MKKKLSKRKWLNSLNSPDTGAVQYHGYYDQYSMNIDMTIWDCSRKISLDFSLYEDGDYKERLKKIRILKESLQEIEDYMNEHYDTFWEGVQNAKEEAKNSKENLGAS